MVTNDKSKAILTQKLITPEQAKGGEKELISMRSPLKIDLMYWDLKKKKKQK